MEIKIINVDKENWLDEMPKLIYRLKRNYNFYYMDFFIFIKDTDHIINVVKKDYKKHRHQIVLYTNKKKQEWYLVVYAKKTVQIYRCDGYKHESFTLDENNNLILPYKRTWESIKHFMNKFALAYEGAVNEQIIQGFQKGKNIT